MTDMTSRENANRHHCHAFFIGLKYKGKKTVSERHHGCSLIYDAGSFIKHIFLC